MSGGHRRGRGSGRARARLKAARAARPAGPANRTDAECVEVIRSAKTWLDDLRACGFGLALEKLPDGPARVAKIERAHAYLVEREATTTT